MKKFKKVSQTFQSTTDKSKKLLEEILEHNKKTQYFLNNPEVKKILNSELSVIPGERYSVRDGKTITHYIQSTPIEIDHRDGMIRLVRNYKKVKTDGKVSSNTYTHTSHIPGGKNYNWDSDLVQVDSKYKPGPESKQLSLEEAIAFNNKDRVVKIADILTKAFASEGINIKIRLILKLNTKRIFIDKILMDGIGFHKLMNEGAIFFTQSLLNANDREQDRYKRMMKAGYGKRRMVYKIEKTYEELRKKDSELTDARLEMNYNGNSCIMFQKFSISICSDKKTGLVSSSRFDISYPELYDNHNLSDEEKDKIWNETKERFPLYND